MQSIATGCELATTGTGISIDLIAIITGFTGHLLGDPVTTVRQLTIPTATIFFIIVAIVAGFVRSQVAVSTGVA